MTKKLVQVKLNKTYIPIFEKMFNDMLKKEYVKSRSNLLAIFIRDFLKEVDGKKENTNKIYNRLKDYFIHERLRLGGVDRWLVATYISKDLNNEIESLVASYGISRHGLIRLSVLRAIERSKYLNELNKGKK